MTNEKNASGQAGTGKASYKFNYIMVVYKLALILLAILIVADVVVHHG